MKRNPIETLLGAVVLVIAAMFMMFAYSTADVGGVKGYEVRAGFLKVGGLETGSDVRISGINIGTVTGQTLNPETFQAEVVMSISSDVQLPTDTEASIVGDGLLGGKYVNLKVTGRVNLITARVGFPVTFGTLEILPRTCVTRPPEETPENAAFLEVFNTPPDGQKEQIFSGWMFASSPAVSALDHPVYDIWVLRCENANASSSAP
jgi:phospholipid/cholesterol/gamma-HCH transport system substrate-binding protein